MDVLTNSSLTLIVKTSEQDKANALENAGGDSSLFASHLQLRFTVVTWQYLKLLPKVESRKELVRIYEILMTPFISEHCSKLEKKVIRKHHGTSFL